MEPSSSKTNDTPIVFKDLIETQAAQEFLLFGGNLLHPFNPSQVFIGKKTQRVYYLRDDNQEICLIHADTAQKLAKGFHDDWWEWKSKKYPLIMK